LRIKRREKMKNGEKKRGVLRPVRIESKRQKEKGKKI